MNVEQFIMAYLVEKEEEIGSLVDISFTQCM